MKHALFIAALLIIAFAGCKSDKSDTLLYASREASIGGEYFSLLDSASFEYGSFRSNNISTGTYELVGDTLYLNYSHRHTEYVPEAFVFKADWLLPIGGEATRLKVLNNRLKQ